VVTRLNREFDAALKSPDVVKQLRASGIDASPSSPAEYLQYVRSEEKRWVPIIKAAGITAQ
jgi:tripartite-type tricarboxylate transporter receptor subunit TctC